MTNYKYFTFFSFFILLLVFCSFNLIKNRVLESEFPQIISHDFDKEISDDFEFLWLATCYVESGNNPFSIGADGDYGIAKIREIYVRECNRLLGYDKYVHTDAFSVEKSKEMWYVIKDYRNKENSIEKQIFLHNKGKEYREKVLQKFYELSGGFSI